MTAIRPSADKPVADYYFQPWWVREVIRAAVIMAKTDISKLSDKDQKLLLESINTMSEALATIEKE